MAAAAVEIGYERVEVIDLVLLVPVQYRSYRVDPDNLCQAIPQLWIRQRANRSDRSNLLVERNCCP
jgi:hypothetical protein